MKKELYCGIVIEKTLDFGEVGLMLGEKEIIVKFGRSVRYLVVFDVLGFILEQGPKPCVTFALYFNQSMQTSRLKVKEELVQGLTPETVLNFIEGSDSELVYNRNSLSNTYSELIGLELRYNTAINGWFDEETGLLEICKLCRLSGFNIKERRPNA